MSDRQRGLMGHMAESASGPGGAKPQSTTLPSQTEKQKHRTTQKVNKRSPRCCRQLSAGRKTATKNSRPNAEEHLTHTHTHMRNSIPHTSKSMWTDILLPSTSCWDLLPFGHGSISEVQGGNSVPVHPKGVQPWSHQRKQEMTFCAIV